MLALARGFYNAQMTGGVHPSGLRLSLRAGPVAIMLALGAVYAQRIVQFIAGSLGGFNLVDPNEFGRSVAWYALSAAAAALFSAPLVVLLAGRCRGASPGATHYVTAVAGAWRLWSAGVLYVFGSLLGTLFFLLPGIFLSIAWAMYVPATVLDSAGPVRALSKSFHRARRGWTRLLRYIAGPYLLYGVIYAISAIPVVVAVVRYLFRVGAGASSSIPGLAHHLAAHLAPDWFIWGVMPMLFAAARLYLFAALVAAWYALGGQER